jgi:hypothetical protein
VRVLGALRPHRRRTDAAYHVGVAARCWSGGHPSSSEKLSRVGAYGRVRSRCTTSAA